MHNLFANCRWNCLKKKHPSRSYFFSGIAPFLGSLVGGHGVGNGRGDASGVGGSVHGNGHMPMAVYHNDPSLPDDFQDEPCEELGDEQRAADDQKVTEEAEDAGETHRMLVKIQPDVSNTSSAPTARHLPLAGLLPTSTTSKLPSTALSDRRLINSNRSGWTQVQHHST